MPLGGVIGPIFTMPAPAPVIVFSTRLLDATRFTVNGPAPPLIRTL